MIFKIGNLVVQKINGSSNNEAIAWSFIFIEFSIEVLKILEGCEGALVETYLLREKDSLGVSPGD